MKSKFPTLCAGRAKPREWPRLVDKLTRPVRCLAVTALSLEKALFMDYTLGVQFPEPHRESSDTRSGAPARNI